ncbi:hypothetical protein GGI02_002765 [Coemansia sp. RSA 2322]|nr:hypothetical protein GGI02_002765 [Coemansia sp. RSA 2322]
MSFAFGKTVFESSLPDLTIGVKDGNLMYTHPEQLLNRKRCRCYMTSSKGYKAYLINYLRYKLHLIVPPTSRRIATRARIINARIKTKLDAFFIGSTSQLAHAQDLNVTPGRTYVGNETLAIRAIMNKYISLAEASYYFMHQGGGFSCGAACNSPIFQLTALNTTWHSPNPASDGYIGVNTADKEIYVAWSGTRRVRSVVVDSMVVFTEFPNDIPGSAVHSGFHGTTDTVYSFILKNIRAAVETYPDFNVVFIGHSLGGANAVISALMFARDNEYTKDRIRVWTFGEPRVGNRRFAEYYTEVLGNQTYRVTNQADIVPHLPPWQILGYQHHPLELHILNKEGDIYVCHKTVREDLGGAYRWPTIDTGVADHVDYFGKPDITLFSPLIEW